MSAPLVPSPLDFVGRRRFSFYPPIRSTGPNDWFLLTGSWSEVQIVNVQTSLRFWIPRQYVGGVSDDGSLLVVELTKELDYVDGTISPRVKRVLEMPHVPEFQATSAKKRRRRGPAPVVGIRVETEEPDRTKVLFKVAASVAAVAVFLTLAAIIGQM